MSRFHGPCGRGALAAVREQKRTEAQNRAKNTKPEDTRWYRQLAAMDDGTRHAIVSSRMSAAKTARHFKVSRKAVEMLWQEAGETA